MTYLELCQMLRAEAGISGAGPATVVGQAGMYGRIVDWVQEAYAEILDMLPWSFLWARVSPVLTVSQTAYTGADFDPVITDLGKVYAGRMRDLTSSGTPRIHYRDWETLDRMSTDGAVGPPRYFARRPDGALVFYPEPDLAYEVQIDYQRTGHTMADNGDLPLIPDAALHKIIVYKALEYYGMHDENMTAIQHGARQFGVLLSRMTDRYAPPLATATTPLDVESNPNTVELV